MRVAVAALEAGPRSFTFRIPLQPGEQVEQNNVQQALVEVRDGREKILYVEGEPRYEMRFIRAAVEADSNIQVVALQRTAENKFLRLSIDTADELASGFPKTRAELFHYRSIILGNMEASFFTHDQLAMLADFVNVRGGGLLFLGGRRSFAEGGYAGTPLADVMPVVVQGDAVPDSLTFFADLKVALTPAGASHAVAQVGSSPGLSVAAMDQAADGDHGQPNSRSQTGRGHPDHREHGAGRSSRRAWRAASHLTSSRSWFISDTGAGSRWRSRCRILGVGR